MQFEKLLKQHINAKSFCVVGNAPTEISKKHGKVIDSFKTIIRFNDFSLAYGEDYGFKTNLWVRATNDQVITTLEEKLKLSFDLIIIRAEKKSNLGTVNKLITDQKSFTFFPLKYESELSQKLKAIPSTGLLFLYILKKNNFELSLNNIYGFSFFDQSDLVGYGSHHYFDPQQTHTEGIRLAKHQWDREKDFFKKYILG